MDSVGAGRARLLRMKSAIHGPHGVLISIEDSGTGIDPKNIDRIFESFFTTKSQGMGMGLSICRSIIEAHQVGFGLRPASILARSSGSDCRPSLAAANRTSLTCCLVMAQTPRLPDKVALF